jgi:hypothetical protein
MNIKLTKAERLLLCGGLIGMASLMLQACDIMAKEDGDTRDRICGNWENAEAGPDILVYKEGELYKVTLFLIFFFQIVPCRSGADAFVSLFHRKSDFSLGSSCLAQFFHALLLPISPAVRFSRHPVNLYFQFLVPLVLFFQSVSPSDMFR